MGMRERIAAAVWLLLGKGGINLRQRVLRLAFSGSLLIVLTAGLLLVGILYGMHGIIREESAKLGESASGYMEHFLEEKAQEQLMEVAASRAQYVESVLGDMRQDVIYLTDCTEALSGSSVSGRESLPNPMYKPIGSGEAYIHYGPRLRQAGIDESLKAQISKQVAMGKLLAMLSEAYAAYDASLFISPKEGYIICVDTVRGGGQVEMTEAFLFGYEPAERPWYQAALDSAGTGQAVFTNVYMGASGALIVDCVKPYYHDGSLAGVVGIGCALPVIAEIVESAKVGEAGSSFVMDKAGRVIFSSKQEGPLAGISEDTDLRQVANAGLAQAAQAMAAGESGLRTVELGGEKYFMAFSPLKSIGWSFAVLLSAETVVAPARNVREDMLRQVDSFDAAMTVIFALILLGLLLLLLLLLALLFPKSAQMARRFTEPLYELEGGVREIAAGNLSQRLQVRTGNELEALADDINFMAARLKEYTENLAAAVSERERIKTELALASSIQAGMLPATDAELAGKGRYGLAAAMYTAKEVGGDFYDFYMLSERQLAVTIADVSGKGIGAALFMVVAKTVLKNMMLSAANSASGGAPDFGAAMERANRRLCEGNEKNMFVTVFFGVLDILSGDFRYVSAGHNPPVVLSAGQPAYLRQKKKSAVLGVIEEVRYNEYHLQLAPGDMLFLYTDGVTEAMDEEGGLYAAERLQAALAACGGKDAEGTLAAVREDVARFVGKAAQSDDMTMLGLRYLGGQG